MFFIVLDKHAIQPDVKLVITKRNFYGVNRITEVQQNGQTVRWLINNITDHGSQALWKESAFEPTTYYTRQSGIGIAITNHPKRLQKESLRIGVVGLGVGTLAAYCTPKDYIRFYELNPDIVTLSAKYFSYITHCREIGGQVDIVSGDGRLSLERELATQGSQQFDILVIDAFTDDVVPVHLLTQEAIRLYISHLSDQGIIALNLSNKYLDLLSAFTSTVNPMHLYSYKYLVDADWFFVTLHPMSTSPFVETSNQPSPSLRPWTDDYSNILPLIKK
jgi:spermidine synthase